MANTKSTALDRHYPGPLTAQPERQEHGLTIPAGPLPHAPFPRRFSEADETFEEYCAEALVDGIRPPTSIAAAGTPEENRIIPPDSRLYDMLHTGKMLYAGLPGASNIPLPKSPADCSTLYGGREWACLDVYNPEEMKWYRALCGPEYWAEAASKSLSKAVSYTVGKEC